MSDTTSYLSALSRFGFELLVPSRWELSETAPLFHGWIQEQSFPEHLLIDVHDYRHVEGGPGILLVAHEANFSLARRGDTSVVQYYRKRPDHLSLKERLSRALRATLVAANRLARDLADPESPVASCSGLSFFSNDRLLLHNGPRIDEGLAATLEQAVAPLSDRIRFRLKSSDPRERFALDFSLPHPIEFEELLGRLADDRNSSGAASRSFAGNGNRQTGGNESSAGRKPQAKENF